MFLEQNGGRGGRNEQNEQSRRTRIKANIEKAASPAGVREAPMGSEKLPL